MTEMEHTQSNNNGNGKDNGNNNGDDNCNEIGADNTQREIERRVERQIERSMSGTVARGDNTSCNGIGSDAHWVDGRNAAGRPPIMAIRLGWPM